MPASGKPVPLSDSDSRGYRPLREAIADYLGAARGVRCTPDQVIIVSGIQHGLDLAARLVIDAGDPVCLEDPCHPMIAAMFTGLGAHLVPTPVDEHGLDVALAEQQCRQPKLIYVTPAHQFPLGAAMPIDRRLALLDWADRSGAWIFEDDYDSEYRFAGRPIPAIQGLDRTDSVILSGSFSKVLLPILRLGYLVVPVRTSWTSSPRRASIRTAIRRLSIRRSCASSSPGDILAGTSAGCANCMQADSPRFARPCTASSPASWRFQISKRGYM